MAFDTLFKKQVPTLDQLHTLIKFVDEGSLAGAFGNSKSAQAAATQRLGRIDRCLGIRTRKSAGAQKIPSDDAKELAAYCREFFQRVTDFKAASERKPNTFLIGAGDSLTFFVLIPALRRTGDWQRKVELQIQNLRSHEIVARVLDGSIDAGLVRTSAVHPKLIEARRLRIQKICRLEYAFYARQSLLAAFPGDHADDSALVRWTIENVPIASFWGERSLFTQALGDSRLRWSAGLRCESFPQVKEAVLAGGYCGILPEVAFSEGSVADIRRFGMRQLADASRDVSLVWGSALTTRRMGGELALRELRSALRGQAKP